MHKNKVPGLSQFNTCVVNLNGVLIKSDGCKGLIFFLHGNAGSIHNYTYVAEQHAKRNYDVFMLDYRGFGKSEGQIQNQKQMYSDVQLAYYYVMQYYSEADIIIEGYSIGTGPASWLAANNKPKLLVLQAPYYSLPDLMKSYYPLIPTFILKYTFSNAENIKRCAMPVVLFHGTADEVIYYGSSEKLNAFITEKDTLITLHNQGHSGIANNAVYKAAMGCLLE